MPDYSKGIIYKITGGGLTYYGSTTQKLNSRFSIHKNDKKIGKNLSVNPILDYDDCKIEVVENYPCNSKNELLERERFYIDNNTCINKVKPIISNEELKINKKLYQQNHKEMSSNSIRKWEQANKEYRKEYHKLWYLKKKQEFSHHS